MGVLSTLPVDFLIFLPGNRNHHHFSDDVGCHERQLVYHCDVVHCEVEDEDVAGGFLWLSVEPPSSFSIDIVIEVFFLLRFVDLLVDVVDVLDVSVQEIAAFPPSERLAF